MASYSLKYTSASNPLVALFITWETGYKNMRVYHDGKELFRTETSDEIANGIEFSHPDGGKVYITFTEERPISLLVKVGNERYYASKKMQQKEEDAALGFVAYAFWTLFGLSLIGTSFLVYQYRELLFFNEVKVTLIIDGSITLCYGVTAFFITRRVKWIYFLGTGVFTLTTILVILSTISSGNYMQFINVAIRLLILAYILRYAMRIIRMSTTESKNQTDILDTV